MYTAKESIKRTMILFAVICCIASVISAVLFVYSNFSTNILSANTLNDFSSGWTYNKDGESVSAAINSSYYDNNHIVFKNTLPENIKDGDCIFFENMYQAVSIKVNGEIIYEYAHSSDPLIGSMFGNQTIIAELPSGSASKSIEIQLTNPYTNGKVFLTAIEIGQNDSIISNIIIRSLPKIFFISLLYVSAAVLFAVCIFLRKHKSEATAEISYLAAFIALSATWLFTDSNLAQFIFTNIEAVVFISFTSFMLLPVPFFSVISYSAKTRKTVKALSILSRAFLVLYIINLLLYVTGTSDFIFTVTAEHLLLVISIIVSLKYVIKESVEPSNFEGRFAAFSIVSFAVFGIIGIAVFYINPAYDRTLMFCIGLAISISALFVSMLKRILYVIDAYLKTADYRNLAFKDPMTKLFNRNGFQRKTGALLPYIEKHQIPVGILMIDVDLFKQYNDNFGHYSGDSCLVKISDAISASLRCETDIACRFGGEEFMVFLYDTDIYGSIKVAENIRTNIESLKIKAPDGSPSEYVTVSIGVSSGTITTSNGLDILKTEADEELYNAKKRGRNITAYRDNGDEGLLERSIESLKLVYENSPYAFSLIRMEAVDDKPVDFTFIYANQALADVEKIPLDSIIGHKYHEIFKNADDSILNMYYETSTTGEKNSFHAFSPETGKYLKIDCFKFSDGYCGCMLTDDSDVHYMSKLTSSELNNVLKVVSGGIIVTDNNFENSRIRFINQSLLESLGYSSYLEYRSLHPSNQSLISEIHPDDIEVCKEAYKSYAENAITSNLIRIKDKWGNYKYFSLNGKLLIDENENDYILFIIFDIGNSIKKIQDKNKGL